LAKGKIIIKDNFDDPIPGFIELPVSKNDLLELSRLPSSQRSF
jgi:hypothetical protein